MRSELLKGHLDMLILAALRTEPAHGYLVLERLRDLSDGEFSLPEGTVYPALHRLEREGLLCSRSTTHQGRARRVYSITERGVKALAGKRSEWERFTAGIVRTLAAAR
jgi:DNA-binding PadR family transcriptional regulator